MLSLAFFSHVNTGALPDWILGLEQSLSQCPAAVVLQSLSALPPSRDTSGTNKGLPKLRVIVHTGLGSWIMQGFQRRLFRSAEAMADEEAGLSRLIAIARGFYGNILRFRISLKAEPVLNAGTSVVDICNLPLLLVGLGFTFVFHVLPSTLC